ncbi:hypothetical protein WA158_008355 [Blastocystis sp. Blastoise]
MSFLSKIVNHQRHTKTLVYIYENYIPESIEPIVNVFKSFYINQLELNDKHASIYSLLTVVFIVLALFGVLMNLIISIVDRFSNNGKSKNNKCVLFGPCGAGKTALFNKFLYGRHPKTVTSISMNEVKVILKGDDTANQKRIDLIDYPGHPSMKNELNSLLTGCLCGIFVIDGTNPKIQECCELLYDLFVNTEFNNNPSPLIICINKQDLHNCKNSDIIEKELEQELDKIKESRGSIEEIGSKQTLKLGVEGQTFSFENDAPCNVYFKDISVNSDKDIKLLNDFILANF